MAKIQVGRDFGTEMEVLSGLEDGSAVAVNLTDDLTEGLCVPETGHGSDKTSSPGNEKKSAPGLHQLRKGKPKTAVTNREDPHIHTAF